MESRSKTCHIIKTFKLLRILREECVSNVSKSLADLRVKRTKVAQLEIVSKSRTTAVPTRSSASQTKSQVKWRMKVKDRRAATSLVMSGGLQYIFPSLFSRNTLAPTAGHEFQLKY